MRPDCHRYGTHTDQLCRIGQRMGGMRRGRAREYLIEDFCARGNALADTRTFSSQHNGSVGLLLV
jgi:hypothetical protein